MADDSTTGGSLRILALLSGDDSLDATTREALSRVDPPFRAYTDPAAALAASEAEPPRLVLCDDANPETDAAAFHRAVGERTGAALTQFLAILPESSEPSTLYGPDSAIEHYLCRPFRAETLTALVRLLLDRGAEIASAVGDDAGPNVQVRRPARFSARPLYGDAVAFVRDAFDRGARGSPPKTETGGLLAEKLHTSLLQGNLLLLRALEPYRRFELPTHCANVAIFSAKIAMGLRLPLVDTLRVIQAGLVHDIGMARLPERILEKEGPLSEEEREEMERHPSYGAELVRPLGPEYGWLERAIHEEHERYQGQGYPRGLAGDEIDEAAQIIGVADMFEAYSHARSYRSPFTSFEALEKLIALRDDLFAPSIIEALADEISVFPLDSYVLLSTGEIGRVIGTNPENLMRPTIEVVWDGAWNPLPEPRRTELGEALEITIERPLYEAEVPIT